MSMLKSHLRTFAFLQKLLDFILATGGWYSVFALRFYFFPSAQPGLELMFAKAGLLVGFLTLYFFSREGLYQSHRLSTRYDELLKVVKGNTVACVTLIVTIYFIADERISRSVILGYYIFSTIAFLVAKLSVRNLLRYVRRKGQNLRRLVLIGHGVAMTQYVSNVLSFKESGILFVGWLDSRGGAEKFRIPEYSEAEVFGKSSFFADGLIISYEGSESPKVNQTLDRVYNDVTPVVILPDLSYSFVGYSLDYHAGVPAYSLNQPEFGALNTALKRVFDLVVSGMGLFLLSPLFLILACVVKFSSRGPILYGQERIGLDGIKFRMWKFRSMRVGNAEPGWTVKDDPRKTKVGSFIRATSLDELPQLWNVFVGDMSLVGPRPEQPFFVEKFRHEIPAYMLRHKMKAGITGWAQVNGWRGDTSLHSRIECDLYYIRHWSLWFDVKILFLTFWKGFINKNAY